MTTPTPYTSRHTSRLWRPRSGEALILLAFLLLLTLYRGVVLATSPFTLYGDEAYYFTWSRDLAFGYYSKPPVIAWLIRLTTSIFGESEFAVRLSALLIYPLTAVGIYLTGAQLFGRRAGLIAAIAFLTIPAVWLSSLVISTDVPLLLFWSWGLYLFKKALDTDRMQFWVLLGIVCGLGLLSKYTMVFFILSALIYIALTPAKRNLLISPRLGLFLLIAFALFSTNLLWNYQYGFISFVHTAEISHLNERWLHPEKLAEFLSGQFGFFGPILMGVFLYLAARTRPMLNDERYRLLLSFALPLLLAIVLLSFLSRAFTNWAAPAYVAAVLLVTGHLWLRQRRVLLTIGILLNVLLGVAFYNFHAIAQAAGIELTRKTDPYFRIMGWRELGAQIQPILLAHPDASLLADHRFVLAELLYYISPHPEHPGYWNPGGIIRDHYALTADIKERLGENFIFVTNQETTESLKAHFASTQEIAQIRIPILSDVVLQYRVFYLRDFKGY